MYPITIKIPKKNYTLMTSKIFSLLLLGLLYITSIAPADHYNYICNHDNQDFGDPQFQDVEEDISTLTQQEEGRVLEPHDYPHIRIYPHYDYSNTTPTSLRNYIRNELAPPVAF